MSMLLQCTQNIQFYIMIFSTTMKYDNKGFGQLLSKKDH